MSFVELGLKWFYQSATLWLLSVVNANISRWVTGLRVYQTRTLHDKHLFVLGGVGFVAVLRRFLGLVFS